MVATMVVVSILPHAEFVSILPHAEFGSNDHREDAPHFIPSNIALVSINYLKDLEPREFPLEILSVEIPIIRFSLEV